jgi:hypothetical protein
MTIGTTPVGEQQLIDGAWALGVANGQNGSYVNGVVAAGTTQAGATQLLPGNTLVQVDTVGANAGVALPAAVQGTEISLYNNGANTLAVYPQIVNNALTGAQDTINNTTSITAATHTSLYFFCAKNGVWSGK